MRITKCKGVCAAAAFEVLPINNAIVNLFLAVQTQWSDQGLNYQGVKAAAGMMGIKRKEIPTLFDGLQVMEYAAMEEMRKDAK